MCARRDLPPYEIMRPKSGRLRRSAGDEENGNGAAPVEEGFWAWTRHPIVLRLPPGYALMLGAGLVLLVVLAYWAGHSRGYRQGDATARKYFESTDQRTYVDRFDFPVVIEPGSQADPRQPGRLYFLAAVYPEKDAIRLAEFLRGRGVAAFAQARHNTRFYVWTAEGFEAGEPWREKREAFRRWLQQLGEEWKTEHRGPDNLPDLALRPYVKSE